MARRKPARAKAPGLAHVLKAREEAEAATRECLRLGEAVRRFEERLRQHERTERARAYAGCPECRGARAWACAAVLAALAALGFEAARWFL